MDKEKDTKCICGHELAHDIILHCVNEHEALVADRKRLEWLMNKPATMLFAGVIDITCDTRDAIDAAMKEESDNEQ